MFFYKGCTKLLNVYWYRDYSIVRPILLSLSLWPWQIERLVYRNYSKFPPTASLFSNRPISRHKGWIPRKFRKSRGTARQMKFAKVPENDSPLWDLEGPFSKRSTHPPHRTIPTVRGCSLTSRRFAFILFSHELREGRTKLTLPAGETYILEWEMCGCVPPRWNDFLPFFKNDCASISFLLSWNFWNRIDENGDLRIYDTISRTLVESLHLFIDTIRSMRNIISNIIISGWKLEKNSEETRNGIA